MAVWKEIGTEFVGKTINPDLGSGVMQNKMIGAEAKSSPPELRDA
jgi:hypothetical protein